MAKHLLKSLFQAESKRCSSYTYKGYLLQLILRHFSCLLDFSSPWWTLAPLLTGGPIDVIFLHQSIGFKKRCASCEVFSFHFFKTFGSFRRFQMKMQPVVRWVNMLLEFCWWFARQALIRLEWIGMSGKQHPNERPSLMGADAWIKEPKIENHWNILHEQTKEFWSP